MSVDKTEDLPKKWIAHDAFLFGKPTDFDQPFDEALDATSNLIPVKLVFQHNLDAAFQIASIPFQLVNKSVLDQLYNRIFSAESIRALKFPDNNQEPYEISMRKAKERAADKEVIAGIALQKMHDELSSPEVTTENAKRVLNILDQHLSNRHFMQSSTELLRQVLKIAWSSFETLANDAVTSLLNSEPKFLDLLLGEKNFRDSLSGTKLLDGLKENNFNLDGKLGTVVGNYVKLDSVEKIKAAVQCCCCDSKVDIVLKDVRLWMVAQQRHLIVHRRGIIDRQYVKLTGDTQPLGDRLNLTSDYVQEVLCFVRDTGLTILKSMHKKQQEFYGVSELR